MINDGILYYIECDDDDDDDVQNIFSELILFMMQECLNI